MKVGDLVLFHNPAWSRAFKNRTPQWGYGSVEEEYEDGTVKVFWSKTGTARTLGKKALMVVSESR